MKNTVLETRKKKGDVQNLCKILNMKNLKEAGTGNGKEVWEKTTTSSLSEIINTVKSVTYYPSMMVYIYCELIV